MSKLRLIALMPQLAARLLPLSLKGLTPVYDRLRARHPTMRTIVNYAQYQEDEKTVNERQRMNIKFEPAFLSRVELRR